MMRVRRLRSVLPILCLVLLAAGAGTADAGTTYVALGDSVAFGTGANEPISSNGYVPRFFSYLRTPAGGGIEELSNRSVTGEDTASIRTSGQLQAAIADIDGVSDTRVVTIDIGANDRNRYSQCVQNWGSPDCPFAANFAGILDDLNAALQRDPGAEKLVVLTFFNPATGQGGFAEGLYDTGLLGSDGRIDCAGTGSQIGLNDRIACVGAEKGAVLADTYPVFKAGGPSFISSDGQHPSDAGHAAIASLLQATYGAVTAITSLTVTPNRFTVARSRTSLATGATIRYSLTTPARVRFTVERLLAGRIVGGRCVGPTRANRHHRSCTRHLRVPGSVSDQGNAGTNSMRFTGRLGGRALDPGRYRLTAVAAGTEGRSDPVSRGFRILRG